MEIFFTLAIAVLFVSCSQLENNDTIDDGSFPIAPIFERYYQELGGQDVLGPAISPLFSEGDTYYQYTTTCLLSYTQATKLYRLAPLGKELNVSELPVDNLENGEDLYINGHNIYSEFNKKINILGGFDTVGLPLTELRLNQEKHRNEQYLENLGFYQMVDDPHGPVFLLAYGAWRCGNLCTITPPLNSRIDIPVKKVAPFVKFIENVGSEYTGFALTDPYLSQDGNLEQVFENVVLFINPDHPDRVILRNLPEMVGYKPDALESPRHESIFFFFPVDEELGINIPVEFLEYIKVRGGFKVSGSPITRLQVISGNTRIQCYEAICLKDTMNAYSEMAISPLPLGYLYRDKISSMTNEKTSTTADEEKEKEISISLWESYPMISKDLNQEIGVAVFEGTRPLTGIQPTLIILIPGGREQVFDMPPTDSNGETRLKLDPIIVESGTLIPYQVCIEPVNAKRFCVRDSYLVWDVVKIEEGHNRGLAPVYQWFREKILQFDNLLYPK